MNIVTTALIADDSAFMRTIVRRILEKGGLQVVGEAEDGIDCIEQYQENRPDLVTLDITMPKMDGLQTLMEIDPAAKVVMVSALGQESIVREAILNGARSFIVKPFQESSVMSAVSLLIQGNRGKMEEGPAAEKRREEESFRSVRALPDYQLEVVMETGTAIRFDFFTRLNTVRFGALRDEEMFRSVRTDGKDLIFSKTGRAPVKITVSEFRDLVLIDRRR